MPPTLSDEEVASMLVDEADSAASRRDKNAPRPNMTFLKNLVRNADSHNAALRRARERDAARARRDGDKKIWESNDRRKLPSDRDRADRWMRTLPRLSNSSPKRPAKDDKSKYCAKRRRTEPCHSSFDPPPRGRGAYRSSNHIDSRFASDYNPETDYGDEDDNGEDSDAATEAFRLRKAWEFQQANRLRQAGFTDDEVRRWDDGGREKDVNHVQWNKRGQSREWDRGKTVDAEGVVTVEPLWAK
ncbi:hypothetical protein K470DRAFT_263582 [Piedraia hortae CBS 480.64]|uniref:Uncharacterized protein n=1 Tax=Piedraia hortae CBS 480.64 TaxID=1314780 RepID=A0A6A7C1P2_9PEZI|nr:hypothetical protein K470DRAFT_263582 [Piedraia hortae CBS 480.64]